MSTVKHFLSTDSGAPVLSGTPGALIGVLDACLVTGWGLQAATSLTVTDGVATLTLPNTNAYRVYQVIEVSGAVPDALNGQHIVTSKTSTTLTFATSAPDGAASGSITVKLAPAGWDKVFSDANKAVYRSPNPLGTRMWLSVDDSSTITANINAFEHMTDVNTGIDSWRNHPYWFKSHQANTNPIAWWMVADDRTFYLRTAADRQDNVYFFGDIEPIRPHDPYACVLPQGFAGNTANSSSNQFAWCSAHAGIAGSATGTMMTLPRSANYISKKAGAMRMSDITTIYGNMWGLCISGSSSQHAHAINFPNPANNGLIYGRVRVHELPGTLRGYMRGIYTTTQSISSAFPNLLHVIDGAGDHNGRKIGVFTCQGGVAPSLINNYTEFNYDLSGRVLFDLTGPW